MSRDKWLLLVELADLVAPHYPRIAVMTRSTKRKYMWRLVRMIERRDGERYTKRIGQRLLVSCRALESLLPTGDRFLTEMEQSMDQVSSDHRAIKKQLNAHGARLTALERKHALTVKYLAALNETEQDAVGT